MSSNRNRSRDFSRWLAVFSKWGGASDWAFFFPSDKCPDDELDLEEHRVF